ncbi:hypothetical protein UFOVP1028_28 [uncultured Caudovirales phage]|uniref:Uncharacterized protein n=1 Tax=uncultured Caudovirales phage TaxID=2100421 RepID=A0A6J5PR14_9CAUD|nr:hypothetical protein UFOVP960_39 [uncultured Caudovirales phage]CAB4179022.1 hypothetical protein UFOVP1028_28 [uncultured Caudovirales phage]CAB4189454.1 hypothetical protein UFOVP1187_37 [uncultured Caudovirales phage]CAB4192112.1 hypothetical protein UFOVP1235_8 [uncultured Caudovirales phage]CAB4215931.1 hypothetical protein UFOVP1488_37 [uncultured Caudovirales phage]
MTVMQEHAITRNGTVSIASFPRFTITAKVYDNDGTLLADFTGASALSFPGVVTTLTAAQQVELAQLIAQWLVTTKAGL